jgi:Uma2 family endonuclease
MERNPRESAVAKRGRLPYAKTMTSTHTLVSEDEYLNTSYEPDCEYWDGELVERNVGSVIHTEMQVAVVFFFRLRRKAWNIYVYTDVRTRVRPGRYLLPDAAIYSGSKPTGKVSTIPPLIWIEILSPDDRPIRINRKVREVLDFGVPYVWVIDPETLESELHTQQGSTILEDGILRIPNSDIEVPLRALEED